MVLPRRDRIRLKTELVAGLGDSEWTWDGTSVLFHEFGDDRLLNPYEQPSIAEMIMDLADSDLVDMYSIVTGTDVAEVEDGISAGLDDGNWKRGYVRLFLSHSALHKEWVGQLASELAIVGIHGFVAHDAMAYTKPWQAQIEHALKTMQAFTALVHPEFNDSSYCQQEAGWALGRRVPFYVIRMGADPKAFIGSDQWPSCATHSPKQVAHAISAWISELPGVGESVFDGMLESLRTAGNYMDAGATAERIAALGSLTSEQFARIDQVWWTNDQLFTGILPSRAMQRVYESQGRTWPPPKPS
jgi:hypothetical protein